MGISRLLRKLLRIPVLILRKTLKLVTAASQPWQPYVLPVGGLSVERASALLFALRQVATDKQVRAPPFSRQFTL